MTDQTGAPKPLKIVGLLAENIKRLTAVEIKPDGSLIELTGKNGAGKSSVLDSISWAIEGGRHIQTKPIREGWREAKIRLDLGEFEITRRFRDVPDGDGTKVVTDIEVRMPGGTQMRRPQEVLNSLLSSLAFDPVAFMQMDAPKQFDTLKRFVPDIDFEKFALDHAKDYQERADQNRRAKDYDAQAQACPADMGATGEPIDEAALIEKLEKAGETNTDIATRKANREKAAEAIAAERRECCRLSDRAQELRAQADALDAEALERAEKAQHAETRLNQADPLPEPLDAAAIRKELEDARIHNSKLVGRGERLRLLKLADEAKRKSAELTKRMEAREAEKQAKIAAAAMPIPGLGFDGEVVTLNGFPFDQASTAEQIRASLGVAMSQNPRLRVILIREGSLIDADGIELIRQVAEAKGFQVWCERVQASGTGPSILIEDGAIKAVTQ